MKTMSAIYQKVRHRLNDDWAYGNGILFSVTFFSITVHVHEYVMVPPLKDIPCTDNLSSYTEKTSFLAEVSVMQMSFHRIDI